MGGSPLSLEPTPMVSSPLHLTAPLLERLVRAPHSVNDAEDHEHIIPGKNFSNIPHHDDPAVTPCGTLMADESTGSSSDLVVRKLLLKSGIVDSSKEKHVAFGEICTRSFTVVLGDHPSCSMGCPLTLGWEYSQCPSVSVDEYEASRPPRRKREDLRTTWDQRRNMLAESDEEVKRANRKLARERSCQRKVNRRACAAFFSRQNLPELPEDCEVTATSVKLAGQQAQTQCT